MIRGRLAKRSCESFTGRKINVLRKCAICGEDFEQKYMECISPSPRNPQWLCWKCYQQGQRENHLAEIRRANRLQKKNENKKPK